MSIAKRLLKITGSVLDLGILLVSDAVDSWSTGESRTQILDRLRDNAERAGELSLENERLRDEVDGLRFNGPTLWRDEAELLEGYARTLKSSLALENVPQGVGDHRERDLKTIRRLLDRCDHMAMTADDFARAADDVTDGRTGNLSWDTVECDHEDDYGSLVGSDGTCMFCHKRCVNG